MSATDPSRIPAIVLCPNCALPLNPRGYYTVNYCTPAYHALAVGGCCGPSMHLPPQPEAVHSSSTPEAVDNVPHPPPSHDDQAQSPPPPPTSSRHSLEPTKRQGKERHNSSDSFSSVFTQFSYNTEFDMALRAVEAEYFPSNPPPSLSSPATETSSTPSTLDVSSSTDSGKRWVVFRGRIPGIYESS